MKSEITLIVLIITLGNIRSMGHLLTMNLLVIFIQVKMEFMLNLAFYHSDGLVQEVHMILIQLLNKSTGAYFTRMLRMLQYPQFFDISLQSGGCQHTQWKNSIKTQQPHYQNLKQTPDEVLREYFSSGKDTSMNTVIILRKLTGHIG